MEPFCRDAAHAHCARTLRSHWFPLVQWVPRDLSALRLFPGHTPAQDASCPGVGKGSIEEPISASTAAAAACLIAGTVCSSSNGRVRPSLLNLLENASFQLLEGLLQKSHVLEAVLDQKTLRVGQAMTFQGLHQLRNLSFGHPAGQFRHLLRCSLSFQQGLEDRL